MIYTQETVAKAIGKSWASLLWEEFNKPYLRNLQKTMTLDRASSIVSPDAQYVFRAFRETPYDELMVVIIGDKPLPDPRFADGLAYSVSNEAFTHQVPLMTTAILEEIERDYGFKDPYPEIDLTRWAKQGVLLLNRSLTVRRQYGQIGDINTLWHTFTNQVVSRISDGVRPIVFMLWDESFYDLELLIDESTHWIIKTTNPLSSKEPSFLGSSCFSMCNELLVNDYGKGINW